MDKIFINIFLILIINLHFSFANSENTAFDNLFKSYNEKNIEPGFNFLNFNNGFKMFNVTTFPFGKPPYIIYPGKPGEYNINNYNKEKVSMNNSKGGVSINNSKGEITINNNKIISIKNNKNKQTEATDTNTLNPTLHPASENINVNEKEEKHEDGEEEALPNKNSPEKTDNKENNIDDGEVGNADINISHVIDNQNLNNGNNNSNNTESDSNIKTIIISFCSLCSVVLILFGFVINRNNVGEKKKPFPKGRFKKGNVVTSSKRSAEQGSTDELTEKMNNMKQLIGGKKWTPLEKSDQVDQNQFEDVVKQQPCGIEEVSLRELESGLGLHPVSETGLGRNSNCSASSNHTFVTSISGNSNGSTISSLINRYGYPINVEQLFRAEDNHPAIFVTFPSSERPFKPALPVKYKKRDPNYLYPRAYSPSSRQTSNPDEPKDSDDPCDEKASDHDETLLYYHIICNKQYGVNISTNRVMKIYNMDTNEYEDVNVELYLNLDEIDDDYKFEYEEDNNNDNNDHYALNEINIDVL